MKSIKVIEEWILVKPEEEGERVSEGGIVIPEKMNKPIVKKAEVVQISEDVYHLLKKEGVVASNASDEEARAGLKYKVGDTVLFYGKTGIPIEDGNVKYMFLKYDGMLAIEVK